MSHGPEHANCRCVTWGIFESVHDEWATTGEENEMRMDGSMAPGLKLEDDTRRVLVEWKIVAVITGDEPRVLEEGIDWVDPDKVHGFKKQKEVQGYRHPSLSDSEAATVEVWVRPFC